MLGPRQQRLELALYWFGVLCSFYPPPVVLLSRRSRTRRRRVEKEEEKENKDKEFHGNCYSLPSSFMAVHPLGMQRTTVA
jgi:hypothetical protein